VQGLTAGTARSELGAAGEAVGQDGGVRIGRPDRRPQAALRTGGRNLVVPALEAEVPGQAAAAGVQNGVPGP
jgi:hypothetical protein